MSKLAIISTYNENCGNASYTHALKNAFAKYIEVEVLPLDLFLLQGTSPALIKAGDRHIKELCNKIKEFDYINIQFEAGLYGGRIVDIYRRIRWLIDACPSLTLTMHRVDTDVSSFFKALSLGFKTGSYKRFKSAVGSGKFANLTKKIIHHCKNSQSSKNIWIKVHTRRDSRSVRIIYGNEKVFDYPLVFLTQQQIVESWNHNLRQEFLHKHGFKPTDKVVGIFGYLSEYKGIETAIKALNMLPPEYKLGVFGSQHPQTVKRNEAVHPYLQSLFSLMSEIDAERLSEQNKLARLDWLRRKRSLVNSDALDQQNPVVTKMADRIRFIGTLSDPEFIEALRLCDAAVLPYLEVGQSMSGIVVLGIESGAKLICANNLSFAETRRYFPDTFLNFDIGNAYELAQKVIFCANNPNIAEHESERKAVFAKYSIDASVRLQLEKFGFTLNSSS
jgi:glycosyltransferase involved in cell wall biosynthesis